MNKVDYFERAESWAVSSQESSARSRRIAWIVAGTAAGIAMLEAVALAMLMPLKTVQPITLLVDRQTGFVQALDPVHPRRIAADEALTQSFLAQYVSAREGFDRATVSADYRRVALWSAGRAQSGYLAEMPAANPASPLRRYPPGTIVTVRVKSVSKLSESTALVRFDTLRQDLNGYVDSGQPWISVIRYRYVDAPMQLQDRLINPLGFQVIGYRRDAEAPRLAATVDPAWGAPPPAQPLSLGNTGAGPVQGNSAPAARAAPVGAIRLSKSTVRTVSLDQLPLGSPLTSNSNLLLSSAGARAQ